MLDPTKDLKLPSLARNSGGRYFSILSGIHNSRSIFTTTNATHPTKYNTNLLRSKNLGIKKYKLIYTIANESKNKRKKVR